MDIVRRKLTLVTMGTQRVKNRKDAKFVQDLSKTNKDVAPQNRASDRLWKKKSNFVGFLGTNSRKNRPFLREFLGQTSPKSNR